jgi:hypothetical protein
MEFDAEKTNLKSFQTNIYSEMVTANSLKGLKPLCIMTLKAVLCPIRKAVKIRNCFLIDREIS